MRTTTALVLAAAALAGCGDVLGLNGYVEGDAAVDSGAGDGSGGGDGGADAKSDAATDGGVEAASCGSSNVCVPDLPNGWAWAPYDPDARPTCATGYDTPTDVNEGVDAAAAVCACGCTTTNPDCTTGNVTITGGNNNNCNNTTNQTDPASAGCHSLTSFATGGGSSISVTGPAPSGGSCSPDAGTTLPAVGFDHQGRTCAYSGSTGPGCASGSVCVPDPAPFAACVSQAGVVACPAGFPNQHLVGTATTDTRGCSPCSCAFDAGACNGSATLYTGTGCTMTMTKLTVDGTCNAVGSHTWRGYDYTPTSTASCAGSAVTADGGVVFSDATTLCCK